MDEPAEQQPERSPSSKSSLVTQRSASVSCCASAGDKEANSPVLARQYSMKSIQSPNPASHLAAQLLDRVECGRKAKEHDCHWERVLSGLHAHKQRMAGKTLRLVSGRQQQVS